MSTNFEIIIAYGVFTDYVESSKLEIFEEHLGNNHKGICIISDGMSGEYTFWGYLLHKTEKNDPDVPTTMVGGYASLKAAQLEWGVSDWAKVLGEMMIKVEAKNKTPLGVYVWTHWS